MYPYKIGSIAPKRNRIHFSKICSSSSHVPVLHAHTELEILLVKSAQFTSVCGTSFYTGDAPCLVFYNKGCYHGTARYYCEVTPYNGYMVHFDYESLETIEAYNEDFKELFAKAFWIMPLSDDQADDLSALIDVALQANNNFIASLGYLMIYLSKVKDLSAKCTFATHQSFGEVYIFEAIRSIADDISEGKQTKVADLPKKFCVCPSKFLKDFKTVTGVPAKEYIEVCALDRAKRMLSQGSGITETAEKCGFSSTSYFIQFFGRRVGITPGNYRKQCKNNASTGLEP